MVQNDDLLSVGHSSKRASNLGILHELLAALRIQSSSPGRSEENEMLQHMC